MGQYHKIFCFWFFSWISFPQASDYTIRTVSNFFRKFAEIFAAQGLPPVSLIPVVHLDSQIFEKIWNCLNGILWGWGGELIHKNNEKQKISWHCPFNPGVTGIRCSTFAFSGWRGRGDGGKSNAGTMNIVFFNKSFNNIYDGLQFLVYYASNLFVTLYLFPWVVTGSRHEPFCWLLYSLLPEKEWQRWGSKQGFQME